MEYVCVICTQPRQGQCAMCEPSLQDVLTDSRNTSAAASGVNALQTAFRARSLMFEQLAEGILTKLNRQGYCVVDKFHKEDKALAIAYEVKQIHKAGLMQNGQLVSSETSPNIRGDQIVWVDDTEIGMPNIVSHMKRVDMLIAILNNKIPNYTITGRTKAMVACYPGTPETGKRYVRHVDNPCEDGRCITTLYYLNKDYDQRTFETDKSCLVGFSNTESVYLHGITLNKVHGGVLRLYPGNTEQYVDIEPLLDRFLIFWSDKRNPHEVLPAYRTRYAVTMWYFDEEERKREGERLATLDRQSQENPGQPLQPNP